MYPLYHIHMDRSCILLVILTVFCGSPPTILMRKKYRHYRWGSRRKNRQGKLIPQQRWTYTSYYYDRNYASRVLNQNNNTTYCIVYSFQAKEKLLIWFGKKNLPYKYILQLAGYARFYMECIIPLNLVQQKTKVLHMNQF